MLFKDRQAWLDDVEVILDKLQTVWWKLYRCWRNLRHFYPTVVDSLHIVCRLTWIYEDRAGLLCVMYDG